ncbi:MAG: hypothetical protein ACXAAK_14975 [Candidatus Thorarchaeota archaeon]|jgi:hypothetical protein
MIEEQTHKFENKLETTYERYYRNVYSRLVEFYRELEKTVPTEQLNAALRAWSERSSIESVGDQRAANFEDFKDYWKTVSYGDRDSRVSTRNKYGATLQVLRVSFC